MSYFPPTIPTSDSYIPDGYLQVDSTTQISYQRDKGNYIWVNGQPIAIGSAGLTCTTAQNILSSTGTDSGAAAAASTLYYIYVSNSSASFLPGALALSATAPSSLNGTPYLGTTGNAANWKHVGWAYTDGSTHFLSGNANRHLINLYNAKELSLFIDPGYVDDNSQTTYSSTSTTLTSVNGGTGSTCSFISNGKDAVDVDSTWLGWNSTAANQILIGLGVDSTTTATVSQDVDDPVVASSESASLPYKAVLAVGRHYIEMLYATANNTRAVNMSADCKRAGGAAPDPYGTYLNGTIRG